MNRYRCLTLALLLAAGENATAADGVRVVAEVVDPTNGEASPFSSNPRENFPADVDFTLEALYPARRNEARARIQLRYSCVDTQTGGIIVPCYITLDAPIARENTGGHITGLHVAGRPTGRNVPSEGAVDQTGYLNSTYHASEIGGVVDVVIHCDTGWIPCIDGNVAYGVGRGTLHELGAGTGYELTGARPPHPSNHWGEPGLITAVTAVAQAFSEDYPATPLRYNDISLEYGGIFDVVTPRAAGYDWTPPHQSHRLGLNMDIGIPQGNAQRALLLRLYQAQGVHVLQEDAVHWHLTY